MLNKDLISPCGLYCGVCGAYQATRKNDRAFLEKFAKAFSVSADDVYCKGCLSDTVSIFCKMCGIKSCTAEKKLEGCYQCTDFPCQKIDSFPIPEGKKNLLRAVPSWRELGTEKWVEEEEKLFTCRSCGNQLFRGAKKCRNCDMLVG
jgi:predicted RNA-binding Zn-ribbon protein involved in translation (DUF1610 family)